jgi:hypothetical protein
MYKYMSGQGGRPAHAVDMQDIQGSMRWDSIQIYRIFFFIFLWTLQYFVNQGSIVTMAALQRHNTDNSKQIFPEKELPGHSPNFNIHVSMSDLCILMTDLPICRKYVSRSSEYKI